MRDAVREHAGATPRPWYSSSYRWCIGSDTARFLTAALWHKRLSAQELGHSDATVRLVRLLFRVRGIIKQHGQLDAPVPKLRITGRTSISGIKV